MAKGQVAKQQVTQAYKNEEIYIVNDMKLRRNK